MKNLGSKRKKRTRINSFIPTAYDKFSLNLIDLKPDNFCFLIWSVEMEM